MVGPDLSLIAHHEEVVDFLAPIASFKLVTLVNAQRGLTNLTQYLVEEGDFMVLQVIRNALAGNGVCAFYFSLFLSFA